MKSSLKVYDQQFISSSKIKDIPINVVGRLIIELKNVKFEISSREDKIVISKLEPLGSITIEPRAANSFWMT